MPNLTLTTSPQELVGSTDGVLIKASSHFTYGFGDTVPSVGIDWSTPQIPLDYKGGRGTLWVWADSVDDATLIYYQIGSEKKAYIHDSDGTAILLDKSGAYKTITEFQNAVHDGESFSYSANQIDLAIGGVVKLLGRTGAKQVHFDGFVVKTSVGPFRIDFYEAPTITNAGTLLTPSGRNRASTNTSLMTIYSEPTASSVGTLLSDDLIVETNLGAHQYSGTGAVDDGWVLKANTDYLIVMANLSGVAVNWAAKFTWHEATYNV